LSEFESENNKFKGKPSKEIKYFKWSLELEKLAVMKLLNLQV
jgi:hypothetical protein